MLVAVGKAPSMPEPVRRGPSVPAAPPPLTQDQKALIALSMVLKKQEQAEIHLTVPGVIGIGMLCTTAYLIWRRR